MLIICKYINLHTGTGAYSALSHYIVFVQQYWVKEGPHTYVPVAAFVEQFRRSPPGKVGFASLQKLMQVEI